MTAPPTGGGHARRGATTGTPPATSAAYHSADHQQPNRTAGVGHCLPAALDYAARGWPVLPLWHGGAGKVPAFSRWQERASTDPGEIRGWWATWPTANVGILCGPRSGLAVLDIDPLKGGTRSLAALEYLYGCLPGTVQVVTGRDGAHLYYAYPGAPLPSGANRLGAGLDVKASAGHQVVAPPSIHPDTGHPYRWLGALDPLTPWPELLTELLEPPPRPAPPPPAVLDTVPAERTLAGLLRKVLDAPEGTRNDMLWWAAKCVGAHMVAGRLDGRAVAALTAAADAAGLTAREIGATIRSGLKAGAA